MHVYLYLSMFSVSLSIEISFAFQMNWSGPVALCLHVSCAQSSERDQIEFNGLTQDTKVKINSAWH